MVLEKDITNCCVIIITTRASRSRCLLAPRICELRRIRMSVHMLLPLLLLLLLTMDLDKRTVIIMLTPIRNLIKMKILLKLVACRCHHIIIFYQISAYPTCTFIWIVDSPLDDEDFCASTIHHPPPAAAYHGEGSFTETKWSVSGERRFIIYVPSNCEESCCRR